MSSNFQNKLKEIVDKIKSIKDISEKSVSEISSMLKSEFSSTLNIDADKWKKIMETKKHEINLEDMSIEEKSFESTLNKIAENIKKRKEVEKDKESAENKQKFSFTFNVNSSFKNTIQNLDKDKGLLAVKQEIIKQASEQGITEEMLSVPCKNITNKLSEKTLSFPESTTFLDAISYVSYMGIMDKDAFNRTNEQQTQTKKQPLSTIKNLMDDALEANKKQIDGIDNSATYQSQPGAY